MMSERNDLHLEDYPYNLLVAIKGHSNRELPLSLTADHYAGLAYVLSILDDRERSILLKRYHEKQTRSRIAEEYGLTPERIRQIETKTCRKLQRFPYWHYLSLGVAGYVRKITKDEYNKGYGAGYADGYKDGASDAEQGITREPASHEELNRPIESLNLSVRALNCLKIAKCKRIADVVHLTDDEISTMKQLGKISAGEIAAALQAMSIKHTAWEKYLL